MWTKIEHIIRFFVVKNSQLWLTDLVKLFVVKMTSNKWSSFVPNSCYLRKTGNERLEFRNSFVLVRILTKMKKGQFDAVVFVLSRWILVTHKNLFKILWENSTTFRCFFCCWRLLKTQELRSLRPRLIFNPIFSKITLFF